MTWDDYADAYILSTGKKLPVESGILGIAGILGEAKLFNGGDCNVPMLTPQERQEVARFAIRLWTEYASAL